MELYSPHATWSKVKSAAQGANILIYLGHGNGHPSPYGAFNAKTKDGMGLNSSDGSSSHTYYGEYYIDRDIQLAKNAVVILNRLCYASGNNEWGAGYPSKSTAVQRVDNYGAGFLRANAQAVFAEGIDSTAYILYGLFKTDRTMRQIFWSDPARDGRWDFTFGSARTPGYHATMDPLDGSSRYYRSVIGNLDLPATTWRKVIGAISTAAEPSPLDGRRPAPSRRSRSGGGGPAPGGWTARGSPGRSPSGGRRRGSSGSGRAGRRRSGTTGSPAGPATERGCCP